MLVGSASFANTIDPVKKLSVEKPATTIMVEESKTKDAKSQKPAGLYCSSTIGTVSATYWFCDCDALYAAVSKAAGAHKR
jgi:hypothetical protein